MIALCDWKKKKKNTKNPSKKGKKKKKEFMLLRFLFEAVKIGFGEGNKEDKIQKKEKNKNTTNT